MLYLNDKYLASLLNDEQIANGICKDRIRDNEWTISSIYSSSESFILINSISSILCDMLAVSFASFFFYR